MAASSGNQCDRCGLAGAGARLGSGRRDEARGGRAAFDERSDGGFDEGSDEGFGRDDARRDPCATGVRDKFGDPCGRSIGRRTQRESA
jgi:hypothetical protein